MLTCLTGLTKTYLCCGEAEARDISLARARLILVLIGDDLPSQALPYSLEGTWILMGAKPSETECIQQ